MKKQEAWLVAKERELKERVREERDKEIELVISRLEDDGVQAREECERAAENRIKYVIFVVFAIVGQGTSPFLIPDLSLSLVIKKIF